MKLETFIEQRNRKLGVVSNKEAWATTISGVIMTIVGYVVAQRYVKITWEWKPILVIYSMFLIAVVLSLIDYSFPMYLYMFLLLKFMCILTYIIYWLCVKSYVYKKN
jgi:hypothetical protein